MLASAWGSSLGIVTCSSKCNQDLLRHLLVFHYQSLILSRPMIFCIVKMLNLHDEHRNSLAAEDTVCCAFLHDCNIPTSPAVCQLLCCAEHLTHLDILHRAKATAGAGP